MRILESKNFPILLLAGLFILSLGVVQCGWLMYRQDQQMTRIVDKIGDKLDTLNANSKLVNDQLQKINYKLSNGHVSMRIVKENKS